MYLSTNCKANIGLVVRDWTCVILFVGLSCHCIGQLYTFRWLKRQSQQKLSAFVVCWNDLEAFPGNSVDPDQTAPIGAVWSGSTLFVSVLNFVKQC